jgi:DNA-binding transcriptional MerR regulator
VDKNMRKSWSISDLAAEFDVTPRTIRFYEEKGLLKPRREGTRRIFSASDRTRLRLILRGRRLGFSLDESAEIIDMYGTPTGNRRQLQRLLGHIREKQAQLEQQMADLAVMKRDLDEVERRCRNELELNTMGAETS